MDYKLLELDAGLFGFKVAKILLPQLSLIELQTILNELHKQNIRLVYWPSDSTDEKSQQAAKKLEGFLGSEHITYLLDLKTLDPSPLVAPEIEIYERKSASIDIELEQLAIQAGTYSHFNTDPNFPKELFLKLYRTWIENSVNGSVASRILVIRNDNKIVGMTTLGTKNNRGDIGLLAVNTNFRGKNFGTKLVCAAQTNFIESGFSHAQVVTQKANVPACRLYEKCNFRQEKIENFYHFWL
ncbi:dTDP-4-amino-4,6-dideoxy-D-galactose acyltransferase [Gammaproteobacteria bacterium]